MPCKFIIHHSSFIIHHSSFQQLLIAEEEVITARFHKVQITTIGCLDMEGKAMVFCVWQCVATRFMRRAVTQSARCTNWQSDRRELLCFCICKTIVAHRRKHFVQESLIHIIGSVLLFEFSVELLRTQIV